MSIVKSYSQYVSIEDIKSGGTTNYCSWDRLRECLNKAAGCSHKEEVIGFIADQDGLTLRIKDKPNGIHHLNGAIATETK